MSTYASACINHCDVKCTGADSMSAPQEHHQLHGSHKISIWLLEFRQV
jgi:hypothetical protein